MAVHRRRDQAHPYQVTSGNELPDVLTFGATTWSTRNTYADAGALLNLDEYFAEGSGYSTAF